MMNDDTNARDQGPDPAERLRAAEERARMLELRLAVERSARRAGVVDEDAAFQLLDRSRVEWDETGAPANVETLLEELLRRKPWLRQPREVPAPAVNLTNPAREAPRRLTREAIRRMTPEEINANWEAIEAALRET